MKTKNARKIRVGLNLLFVITDKVGGVETFARELIAALRQLNEERLEYVVYGSLDCRYLENLQDESCEVRIFPFHASSRAARYFWEQVILPVQALRDRLDVLHSMSYVGPIVAPVPAILTIHDANSRVVGTNMPWLRRTMLWTISKLSSITSSLVTTNTEFAKGEVLKWYKLPPEKVKVILPGYGKHSHLSEGRQELTMYGVNQDEPYIAVIGGSYPHKNIGRLLGAYDRIKDKVPHKLIIIGNLPTAVKDSIPRGNPTRIMLTGYVSDAIMAKIIRDCDLFVMPSLYEGFGYPVLEAQMYGVPVACSNRGALLETTGSSAEHFDPENIDDIAAVILSCLIDREKNGEMRLKSAENCSRFTWSRAAAAYYECYIQFAKRGQSNNRRLP